MSDDYAIIRRLTAEIEAHRTQMHRLAVLRRSAILRLLRPDHGYGSIAANLGISRARVQQMANNARADNTAGDLGGTGSRTTAASHG